LAQYSEILPGLPARQEIPRKGLELGEFENRQRDQAAEFLLMS